MKCPICEIELAMTDRQGVEIDYCPKCRGVWLDRGELDKIIEKSLPSIDSSSDSELYSKPINGSINQYEYKDHDEDDRGGHGRNNKKSLLGELFDF